VDVVEAKVYPNRNIWIENGRIVDISGAGDAKADDDETGWTVLRLNDGHYVLPGLIDCHVHVTAFTANFALLEQTSPTYVAAKALETLNGMLLRGFTTVRDAGGADHGLAQAVEERAPLGLEGSRLLFCGKALSQTGGHGDMRAPGQFAKAMSYELCQCCAGLGRVCDGDAEVRRAARDEIRKGATHIKVMAGGGVASPTDRITSTQFSLGELKAIVEEATAANIPVMAHAYTPRAIINAVKAGVSSIEHGNLLDDASAAAMADAGTFLVPTLLTYEMLKKDGAAQGMPPNLVAKVDGVLKAGKQSIEIAKKHKVKMAFGTDCLAKMREPQLEQFRLLHEAGMTPTEILRTATCYAAELIDRKGELGVVAKGAIADLLIVKGNPLDSIQPFLQWNDSCYAIFKEGRLCFSGKD